MIHEPLESVKQALMVAPNPQTTAHQAWGYVCTLDAAGVLDRWDGVRLLLAGDFDAEFKRELRLLAGASLAGAVR